MASTSFLIVNYYTAGLVQALVKSIREHVIRHDYQILIYDNSGDKQERTNLKALESADVHVYQGTGNIGFVAANNVLFAGCSSDIVVLLNPDTLLIDSSLEGLIDLLAGPEPFGAVGPMLLNADGSYQVSCYRFPDLRTLAAEHFLALRQNVYAYKNDYRFSRECDVVKGACLAFRRSSVGAEKLFDENLVLYSEEADLCMRFRRKSLKNYYCADARLCHYGEQSTSRGDVDEYVMYHYHRSKLYFIRKYYSRSFYFTARGIILLSLVEKIIVFGILGRMRKARIHSTIFRKLVRGEDAAA